MVRLVGNGVEVLGVSNARNSRSDRYSNVIASIFKASQRIGIAATMVGVLAWLIGGALAALAAADAPFLWRFPVQGMAVEITLLLVVAIGGLLSVWLIAHHLSYLGRGYRVRWTHGNEWLYEERTSVTKEQTLPFTRKIVGDGYPVPSEVCILSESSWASDAPTWAQGRREEIADRIANCFGRDRGASIRFLEASLTERSLAK